MKLVDLEKILYMDYLIQQEGTGNPEEFAKRLQFSRSTFFKYLAYLREDLRLDIKYSLYKQSYYYEGKGLRCSLGNKECTGCRAEHKNMSLSV